MAFPGVCAAAGADIMANDRDMAVNAMVAKVDNVVRGKRGIRKRRILAYLLQQWAAI
jgi:hypothetical protein